MLTRLQGRDRDDQFGQVAQRGIEKPAHRVTRAFGHRLGRAAEKRRKRNDGKHRKRKEQYLGLGPGMLAVEHKRHEHEEPQKRCPADVCQ